MTEIRCGAPETIRATSLASLLHYHRDSAHTGCDDGEFRVPVVIATTQGAWQFGSGAVRRHIDSLSLVVGSPGDSYSCRHAARSANKGIAVSLKPGAIEEDIALFDKRVIDAAGLLRLFGRASRAASDDEFDSVVFTIFGEASCVSTATYERALRLRVERAKRFIELHAFEPLTISDIARELGLSPFTTIRQFRAATGITPHSYLLDVRLDAAKQRLLRTRDPVECIARSVGFDDLAYFSRFFKRRTGQSPSSFRAA